MIQHVGLTINDTSEISNFYQEILQFAIHHTFRMDEEVNQMIFRLAGSVEVLLMEKEGSRLELFLCDKQETKHYTHICVAFTDAVSIFNRALEKGYKALAKPNREGRNTYFVWDRSGNMFEIKESRQ